MKSLACLIAVAFTSCAGYQLGGVKPASLAHIKTVAVPMLQNRTQHPRAEAIATSAIASAFAQDGTYRVTSVAKAQAVLDARVESINYSQVRANRLDTLRPEELQNAVVITWTLKDASNPAKVLASGASTGTSRFFVDANLQTARNNALPDAMQRAGETLVSRLANGY